MNSGKHTNIQIEIINNILDEVMDEYEADNQMIFTNDSERSRYFFGLRNERFKSWKKPNKCMVPGCLRQSINKSHVIPKGMSLSLIKEEDHLLTPAFNYKTGRMELKSSGISNASTFPGFCPEHESLFKEFEVKKKMEKDEHIYLQTYRAACRELYRLKFVIDHCEKIISTYCNARDEKLMNIVKQKAAERGIHKNLDIRSITYKNDSLVKWVKKELSEVKSSHLHYESRILPSLNQTIFNNLDDDIFIQAFHIDIQIPVALSGSGSFWVSHNCKETKVELIINVIPCTNHSIIILCGDIQDKEYIQHYISRWTINTFSVLSMIETWMVNGTDQWYIKPSVWNALPESRKVKICTDIFENKHDIGSDYEWSIFDELRLFFIKYSEKKEELARNQDYLTIIKSQYQKMT